MMQQQISQTALAEVRRALERYRAAVEASTLAPDSKRTYLPGSTA